MFTQIWSFIQQLFPYLVGFIQSNSFPQPLDKQTETLYLEKLSQGDKDARDKLIEHNLRLVVHIVKKFDFKKELFEDMISVGTIGLIKAIDSFDVSKGHKLTTYASKCIENEILMTIRNNKKHANTCSIEDAIGHDKDGEPIKLEEVLFDENTMDIIDKIMLDDNKQKLLKYLNNLTEKEKRILYQRYGLFNHDEKTQKEIAEEENISRSYVSRIEKRAFTKLLKAFKKNEE